MNLSVIFLLLILLAVYFLPAIVAKNRNHRATLAIFILNIFAGWTFIAWVIALVWACTPDVKQIDEK